MRQELVSSELFDGQSSAASDCWCCIPLQQQRQSIVQLTIVAYLSCWESKSLNEVWLQLGPFNQNKLISGDLCRDQIKNTFATCILQAELEVEVEAWTTRPKLGSRGQGQKLNQNPAWPRGIHHQLSVASSRLWFGSSKLKISVFLIP